MLVSLGLSEVSSLLDLEYMAEARLCIAWGIMSHLQEPGVHEQIIGVLTLVIWLR